HRVELGADDGRRGAHLQARGVDAVLAHVGHHQPGGLAAVGVGAELLDELDVPPVDVGEANGVVVAVAAEDVQLHPLGRQLVPLVTGHLTRLAADAHGRVGVEADGFGHGDPLRVSSFRAATVRERWRLHRTLTVAALTALTLYSRCTRTP